VDPELAELTATAATALVRQLATDSWEGARSAVATLWRRARPGHADAGADELADSRAEVLAAREAGDEQAEDELVASSEENGGPVTIRVRATGSSRVTVAGRDVHVTGV
jgi:hypothetical protein